MWDASGKATTVRHDRKRPATGAYAAVTGIPACDEYLGKYARCIADKVPVQVRAQMNEAMDASVKAWNEAANGPAREGLAAACRTALDAARTATESLGCEW